MESQKTNLRSDIDFVRETLTKNKYVIQQDLPLSELEEFAGHFGVFVEQYGSKLYPVRPTSKIYSSSSATSLFPHTDHNEHPDNEIIVGLYTERQDKFEQGGHTGLYDMRGFIESLSVDEFQYALETDVTIVANNLLKKQGAQFYHGPMLKIKDDGSYAFRFSYNFTMVLQDDGRFLSFREKVISYYHEHKITVKLPKNGLLLFDNSIFLHDRSNIYDLDRSLYRFYLKPHKQPEPLNYSLMEGS